MPGRVVQLVTYEELLCSTQVATEPLLFLLLQLQQHTGASGSPSLQHPLLVPAPAPRDGAGSHGIA